jgi:hypothetical protein
MKSARDLRHDPFVLNFNIRPSGFLLSYKSINVHFLMKPSDMTTNKHTLECWSPTWKLKQIRPSRWCLLLLSLELRANPEKSWGIYRTKPQAFYGIQRHVKMSFRRKFEANHIKEAPDSAWTLLENDAQISLVGLKELIVPYSLARDPIITVLRLIQRNGSIATKRFLYWRFTYWETLSLSLSLSHTHTHTHTFIYQQGC